MVEDNRSDVSDSAAIKRIEILADCILEDRLPLLVPGEVQAALSEINLALNQVDPEAIPPAWFFAKAASSACSDFIIRFGLANNVWQPWLSEIRNLAAGITANPWNNEEQVRLLAQCIPFYRNVSGDSPLGRYSQVQRKPLFPMLTDLLEDRYAWIGRFAIEDEITNSTTHDDDPGTDSLCSILLLESEVRVYGQVFLGGGADLVNEAAQKHTRHLVCLLGALIAATLGRHALTVRQGTLLPAAWYDVERCLRSAFIRVIQRTPLRDSAVPNQGTHDYVRTGTHAVGVVRERYREMFFDTFKNETQLHIEPVSSGMAAVSLCFPRLSPKKPTPLRHLSRLTPHLKFVVWGGPIMKRCTY